MAGRPPLKDEPSNAVLATQIENLSDKIEDDRKDEVAFHSRLEGRLDQLTQQLIALTQQVVVAKAEAEAKITAAVTRMDTHDTFHRERDKEERDAKARTGHVSSLIVGVLTALGTIGGVVVTLILH